jgi:hypothetical protein
MREGCSGKVRRRGSITTYSLRTDAEIPFRVCRRGKLPVMGKGHTAVGMPHRKRSAHTDSRFR